MNAAPRSSRVVMNRIDESDQRVDHLEVLLAREAEHELDAFVLEAAPDDRRSERSAPHPGSVIGCSAELATPRPAASDPRLERAVASAPRGRRARADARPRAAAPRPPSPVRRPAGSPGSRLARTSRRCRAAHRQSAAIGSNTASSSSASATCVRNSDGTIAIRERRTEGHAQPPARAVDGVHDQDRDGVRVVAGGTPVQRVGRCADDRGAHRVEGSVDEAPRRFDAWDRSRSRPRRPLS